MAGLPAMDAIRGTVRYAARRLLRTPGFTVTGVLTLALGIGGVVSAAAVVVAILLRPLPYPSSDRLVGVWTGETFGGNQHAFEQVSDGMYFAFQRLTQVAAAWGVYEPVGVNIAVADVSERSQGAVVSSGFFPALDVVPRLGRTLGEADDQPGSPPVAVISERLWKRRFGESPTAIGQTIRVNGTPHQIVGVIPRHVALPQENTDLWLPARLDPNRTSPLGLNYHLLARLAPGVTLETAQRDLQRALSRVGELFPEAGGGFSTQQFMEQNHYRVLLHPLRDDVVGDASRVLWVLTATLLFVLLVACASVANLFLIRAEAREREIALRIALGARYGEVVAEFAVEGLLLATASAALGVILTLFGVRQLARTAAIQIPRMSEVTVDGSILLIAAVLAVVVGLGCSIIPLLRFRARQIAPVLQSGGRGATRGAEGHRIRQGLIVAQMALSFALLAGASLLVRTFRELRRVEPGFRAERVLTLQVALPGSTYPKNADLLRFYDLASQGLLKLPGVTAVAAVSKLPLRPGGEFNQVISAEGRADGYDAVHHADIVFTLGNYSRTFGIPLLVGRALEPGDERNGRLNILVSASLARQEWGDATGRAALGRRLRFTPNSPWLTVVGVVGDVRSASLDRAPAGTIYLPFTTSPYVDSAADRMYTGPLTLVLSGGERLPLPREVYPVIRDIDPLVPVFDTRAMTDVLSGSIARTTFTSWVLGAAAVLSLFLGMIGLYGVIAYAVSLRTREFGLRIALGARPIDVDLLLVRQGMLLSAVGIGLGVVLTLVLARTLRALLYGVGAADPLTLIGVAVVLVVATLAATWIPAHRAGRIDPTTTLAGG